jgi:DNA-directed RNA polymerase specialized sigma24 family protein
VIYQDVRDPEEEALDKMSVEWLMQHLSPEERDIVYLWAVEDYNFDEIGQVVGQKYYGKAMLGTTVRYRKDKIMRTLRALKEEVCE